MVAEALRLKVAVIFKDTRAGDVSTAERALRHVLNPELNPYARPKPLSGTLKSLSRPGSC
jgi:hypothetical protein